MRVAAIRPHPKDPHQLRVEDAGGGAPLDFLAETVLAAGLAAGMELDAKALESMLARDLRLRCERAAWAMLEAREVSQAGLAQRLARDFPEALAREVADALAARGHVDDARLARRIVEEGTTRRAEGPARIEARLHRAQIDEAAAREAIEPAAAPDAQRQSARRALETWLRGAGSRKSGLARHRAAAGFLARRGFDESTVLDVVEELLGSPEDFPDENASDSFHR